AVHLDGSASRPGVPSTVTTATGREVSPSWSPDGKEIAFAVDTGFPDGISAGSIVRANAAGTNPRPLLPAPPQGLSHRDPAWSPGGRYLAFTETNSSGEDGTIVIQDLQTGSRTAVPACT